MAAQPVFPPGRYGRRRAPDGRRRLLVAALVWVLGAAVGLAVAVELYRTHGSPPYEPTIMQITIADDHATVRFRVHKPADRTALCQVRARARTGEEVGTADVPVPAGDGVVVEYTLATTGRPFAVDVPACGPPR